VLLRKVLKWNSRNLEIGNPVSSIDYPGFNQPKNYRPSAIRLLPRGLFVYDLDLLVDYLANKPVDRDVHPVTLLALGNKGVLKTWFSSKIK
jgi:hypothetical protein